MWFTITRTNGVNKRKLVTLKNWLLSKISIDLLKLILRNISHYGAFLDVPIMKHCVKSFQIRSFLWSKYRQIRTRKKSVFGHFSRSKIPFNLFLGNVYLWFLAFLGGINGNIDQKWFILLPMEGSSFWFSKTSISYFPTDVSYSCYFDSNSSFSSIRKFLTLLFLIFLNLVGQHVKYYSELYNGLWYSWFRSGIFCSFKRRTLLFCA